jgi:hypothetical protein
MRLRRGIGSIPTAMPACCFVRAIEAKPDVFAAVPEAATDDRLF